LADFTWVGYDNTQDIILGLRKAGSPDLVFDLGSYNTFNSARTIDGSLVTGVFGSNFDGVSWSVSGAIGDPNSTDWKTLFMTDPATVNGLPANKAWQNKSSGILGQTTSKIGTLGGNLNTAVSLSLQSATLVANNALTITPNGASLDKSYTYAMTKNGTGNYGGTFQGKFEGTLPTGFSTGATHQQMDFYEVQPTDITGKAGASTLLGTFDFAPDGAITFTPTPEPSVCALAGLAFLGLAGGRWFKRRA
jgi:hypothetical protein